MSRAPSRRFVVAVISLAACALLVAYLFRPQPAAAFQAKDGGWKLQEIPSVWKRPPANLYRDGNGYAWFRCLVKIPAEWQGKGELQLFSEPIDDAREAYVNGVKVGAAGAFPPQYRSGLGGESRFAVPEKLVRFGQMNTVAIRIFDDNGRRNFNVAAPVLFGGDGAIRMTGKWQYRAGDDLAWAKWEGDRPASGDAVFTKVESAADVNRTLRKLQDDDGPLSPAESLQRFKVPGDLALDQVLADPIIGQPLYFTFDERGRLWLVQYLQYPNPAGLKAISRDRHLRTVYDKVPPPPPNHFRGADKITIHEDTDGDGRYDKHKTFVEGLNIVSAAVKGRGGLWVLNPPYLLFYADKNNDDMPDGDPVVHLEGFGIEDSHSVVNSLCWGPDGWLYAAQGSTVTGHIKRPGTKDPPVHSMGQLIWRYHPETRRYEIFAEGGGNAFGVEIDSAGRVFSGHNGGDTRGFHYMQGAYFRKGFAKHGELSNPYAFGYFPHIPHHKVPRFTHSFVIYEGAAMSQQYDGKLFGVGPLQSHVIYSQIDRDGSSFKSKDLGTPITTSDKWFRPVAIKVGPDGGIYVADLYEQRIDHASHYQGRVHKESGRVYRLRDKNAEPIKPFDYGTLSSRELVKLLEHPNKWHRHIALRLLGDRQDKSVVPLLREMLDGSTEVRHPLEALWALNLSGGLTVDMAAKTLRHEDPQVRLWTVRLLCDSDTIPDKSVAQLAEIAFKERHIEVRCQLACSVKRLPTKQSLPILQKLLQMDDDASDPRMPLLLWWAIEAKCEKDADAVLVMFRGPSAWAPKVVQEHILERLMRRFASAGTRKDLLVCARLFELAPTKDDAKRLLAGFEKAFEGRSLGSLPQPLVAALAKVGGGSLALQLRLASTEAVDQALKIITDNKAKKNDRLLYVRIFGEINQPRCVPVLLGLLRQSGDDELRAAVLTALQSYRDAKVAPAVIALHNKLPGDVREVAQTLLASRKAWALEYARAIDSGKADKKLVPMPIVRKLLFHDDKQLAALVQKHFGKVQGATTTEMRKEIERYSGVIAAASGNPYNGKKLYGASCGKCHVLFTDGGKIGPDLTAYKRDDLKTMLLNVVNPSAEIREGFENYLIYTADGRALNGFVIDQDAKVVVLKGIDGQSVTIPRDNIDQMAAVPRSLMPEGILRPMKPQEVRDLFAYLRATQPLP